MQKEWNNNTKGVKQAQKKNLNSNHKILTSNTKNKLTNKSEAQIF
jgi:hypothetical protein